MKTHFSIFVILAAQAAHAGESTMQAIGDFDVKLTPQTSTDTPPWGRMRLDKVFHGPLAGTSIGEMLAVRTEVPGSAGYVAIEQVSATLNGRKGTFFFQHSGTMDKGASSLDLNVIPDSGTGELKGLRGKMKIDIDGGKHHYDFTYTLP
jgi:hypothetical protein